MKRKKLIQIGGALLLVILPLVAFIRPFNALKSAFASTQRQAASTAPVNVYLTTAVLQQQFQNTINQTLPTQFNQALNAQIDQIPANSRPLASQIASDLLQPSATLTQLTPQQNGAIATISLSLFPGDTAPSDLSMLVTFNVQDAATVGVKAQGLNGQPSPVSGNLPSFPVVLGQLQDVATTPSCGNAALKLQIVPNQGPQTPAPAPGQGYPVFIEVPASTISANASNTPPLQLSPGLTARNIQVSTQTNNLIATSDIFLGNLKIGSTTTTVQLSAANGVMVASSAQTQVNVAGLSLPINTFNQLIEQQVTNQFNSMLGGVDVINEAFGPTNDFPCVANGNLLIAGTVAQL
jgi:hypothetical protein